MNLKGRNFLTLKDFTPEEITYLIDLSAELKAKKKAGELHEYYKGKNIALIFEKTSTRTDIMISPTLVKFTIGSATY